MRLLPAKASRHVGVSDVYGLTERDVTRHPFSFQFIQRSKCMRSSSFIAGRLHPPGQL